MNLLFRHAAALALVACLMPENIFAKCGASVIWMKGVNLDRAGCRSWRDLQGDASSRVSGTRSVTYHTYPGPRTGADRDEGLGMLVALVGRLTFLIGVAISRSLDTEAGVPSSVRIVSPS